MKNNIKMSKIAKQYFPKLVPIYVTDGTKASPGGEVPIVWVEFEFALILRVGDNLFFEESEDQRPAWVAKWKKEEDLFENAIELTQRNFNWDEMSFYAKMC